MQRKKIKIITSVLISSLLFSLSGFNASANENLVIPDHIQEQMDAVSKDDPANADYLNGVLDIAQENNLGAEETLELIEDSLANLAILEEETNTAYEDSLNEFEKMVGTNKVRSGEGYSTLIALYRQGINLVRAKNCPQTATYMEHAIVPENQVGTSYTPVGYIHTNDSWAKGAILNSNFQTQLFMQFEEELLALNKTSGACHGNFEFTSENSSLDYYTSLHAVSYVATFIQKYGGGFSVSVKIDDIFNFDYGTFDSIQIQFGNNYCATLQNMGYIKPFIIRMSYSF